MAVPSTAATAPTTVALGRGTPAVGDVAGPLDVEPEEVLQPLLARYRQAGGVEPGTSSDEEEDRPGRGPALPAASATPVRREDMIREDIQVGSCSAVESGSADGAAALAPVPSMAWLSRLSLYLQGIIGPLEGHEDEGAVSSAAAAAAGLGEAVGGYVGEVDLPIEPEAGEEGLQVVLLGGRVAFACLWLSCRAGRVGSSCWLGFLMSLEKEALVSGSALHNRSAADLLVGQTPVLSAPRRMLIATAPGPDCLQARMMAESTPIKDRPSGGAGSASAGSGESFQMVGHEEAIGAHEVRTSPEFPTSSGPLDVENCPAALANRQHPSPVGGSPPRHRTRPCRAT